MATEHKEIRITIKRVRVDGLDVEYADTGTGPTILFVHGVYAIRNP